MVLDTDENLDGIEASLEAYKILGSISELIS